jgi:hypothetical protein
MMVCPRLITGRKSILFPDHRPIPTSEHPCPFMLQGTMHVLMDVSKPLSVKNFFLKERVPLFLGHFAITNGKGHPSDNLWLGG